MLGEAGAALPLVERVVDEAIAALCAEAVGAMAVVLAATLRPPALLRLQTAEVRAA